MLGVLLESRAKQQRRSGGMALSVIVHLAIITATVAGTTIAKPAPKLEKPKFVPVRIADPEPPKPVPVREVRRESRPSNLPASNIVIKQIDIPTRIPIGIPEPDLRMGMPADSFVIGGRHGAKDGPIGGSLVGPETSNTEWRGNDAYMNLIKSATPRYPEVLRQSGIDGRVLIRFTVDTLGRIDQASVQVLSETHALFTRAVRESLAGFRFRPAESNGKKVPALAEMPFEFSITKR